VRRRRFWRTVRVMFRGLPEEAPAARSVPLTRSRLDDGRLDAMIAVAEHGPRGERRDPTVMLAEHEALVEAGVLDVDQPTAWSHYEYQRRLTAEFSPEERAQIRVLLGMEVCRD
jgi:hypothetical protein